MKRVALLALLAFTLLGVDDPFEGAEPQAPANEAAASKDVRAVVGTTVTFLSRPAGMARLALLVEAGSFRVRPGYYPGLAGACIPTAGTPGVFFVGGHAFALGDGPIRLIEATTLCAGFDEVTDYYVRPIDASSIRLFLSREDAVAGTNPVPVLDFGSGLHTVGPMPTAPTATDASGYNSILLDVGSTIGQGDAPTRGLVIQAPPRITVQGGTANDVLLYWWLP